MVTIATGTRFGRYEIRSKIGAGGMGEVYLARDTKLDRKVALKILPADVAADRNRMSRFVQEAKSASALNHPNILTIHEVGENAGINFIATEFIEGETLRQRMQGARMKLSEVLNVAIQTADALSAAHDAGIIHRDIKPENIMLRRRDGYVKVLDFGLAKLVEQQPAIVDKEAPTKNLFKTDEGVVLGTVIYMSPEQARGLEVDARTDIWSLGVVLYEMVAGCLPFEGSTASEILASIINEKEPPPLARFAREVPAELERMVEKALRKDREERYQTAKDMLLDLRRLKHKREFEVELERSKPPDLSSAPATALSGRQATIDTAQEPAAQFGEIAATSTPSSAKHLIGKISQHKRVAVLVLAVLVIAAIAAFLLIKRTPALTEKDTILLADFVNTTGDAAFDGTLKQALAIQLEQSPFLNIFSDEGVRATLRFMNRSPDDRVTKDVAREICQRHGLKAYLSGSISNLGSHLVITMEAVNAETGDTLARQQVEAESKEQVLNALGRAATKVREKLGESLASIQKYDAPIEQATTSSLEALKAFSLGIERNHAGKDPEAIPLYKRAIELDPNFALAYQALAFAYANSGQRQLVIEAAQKAFELRDRTSEYEKLKIASGYYDLVTGEIEKTIEALELLTRTYPREYSTHNNLGLYYSVVGRHERGIEEGREAVRLNPTLPSGYSVLANAFRSLNRFDEAKEIYEQALAQKLDRTGYHTNLYTIAFVRGDTAAMQQQLDWVRGKPDEYIGLFWQAYTAAYLGQLRRARELNQRGVDEQLSRNLKEAAAETISSNALRAAVTGNCQQAREDIARASALPRTHRLDIGGQGTVSSFFGIGTALALCGELGQAQSLADEYAKQFPKDTLVNAVWLPAIRAAIEIRRNNPLQAIQFLQSANRYDRTGVYWPEYLRGQAYLAQGAGAEAAAEFQKILDRRGIAPTSVLYPLAHLGLARAAALAGDTAKSRKEYQDFFALWKDADTDIPILIEAKKEYEKVK
jgi:eukaryotic-like serine/threonine-protein kinase